MINNEHLNRIIPQQVVLGAKQKHKIKLCINVKHILNIDGFRLEWAEKENVNIKYRDLNTECKPEKKIGKIILCHNE